jgi:cobalt/nickel transport system permease protein
MNLNFDEYAHLDSLLHRWEPRYKLLALMALIFSFSFVRDIYILPVMLAASALIFIFSGLPLQFLISRLRLPGLFILALAIVLPFVSGQTVLATLGPLAVKTEGCLEMLLITVKFICIFTVGIALFGSMSFLTAVKSMRALGLPLILADMTFFTYRYLHDINSTLGTMETAMRLRGMQSRSRGKAGMLASLVGTLLVRSYEQSDRVYKAMVLRGYGQPSTFREEFKTRFQDLAGLLASVAAAAFFVAAEILLH